MRTVSACLGLVVAMTAAVPLAGAQLHLNTNDHDPVTGLAPYEWEQMVSHMLNGQALAGDPGVLVVSSVPVPLTITCDRWQLVGVNPDSSVKGNPQQVQPFSITYIKTKGFDGYCKNGVVGHAGMGKTVIGHLDAADGSFSGSTVILFSGKSGRE